MTDLTNINTATLHLTSGRDGGSSRYEYHISAMEIVATRHFNDGEAMPVTVERGEHFKTASAAKRAGIKALQALGA